MCTQSSSSCSTGSSRYIKRQSGRPNLQVHAPTCSEDRLQAVLGLSTNTEDMPGASARLERVATETSALCICMAEQASAMLTGGAVLNALAPEGFQGGRQGDAVGDLAHALPVMVAAVQQLIAQLFNLQSN